VKKLTKGAGILSLVVAASSGSFFAGKVVEEKTPQVKKIQKNLSGKKRFVAYDPSFPSPKRRILSVQGVEKISNKTDLFIIKSDKKPEAPGLKVVEDRIYHKTMGCSEEQLPTRPPAPATIPWGIEKTNALGARGINDGASVIVCVADTGSDFNHPDLRDQLVGGSDFTGTGSWLDDQGHGTHVAGTVAATLNDIDVVGVSNAKIYTAKVLDSSGAGYGSWIAEGIVACVQAGAKVINMSLGSPASSGPDPLIRDAVNWAHSQGVQTVCANGNDSGAVGYPAKDCTFAVSALDRNDNIAFFSSRGPETDISAPGVDVLSLKLGGGVISYSGTSMASPHVAGALAQAIAHGKNLKGKDVGLPLSHQGTHGRLDILKSLSP